MLMLVIVIVLELTERTWRLTQTPYNCDYDHDYDHDYEHEHE